MIIFSSGIILSVICNLLYLIIYINKKAIYLRNNISVWEIFFWDLVICVYESICICFLMALFGCYSLINMSIFIIIKNIGLYLYIYQNRMFLRKNSFQKDFNIFILVIVVMSGILYFFFPTEYLWGRRDPMLYVIKGINIANTGSVLPKTSEYLNAHYDEIKDFVDLTYRGVYSDFQEGYSMLPGDITFQFLDFFPALLAIGYSLAGLNGLFRIHMIIAILCLLALYYFAKHFFGRKAGTIAVFLLAVCPAQIWSARITQTELLYQLSWLIGVYVFGIAWKYKNKILVLIAGCVMGGVGFNRIDGYILGLGIYAIAVYYNVFLSEESKLVNIMAGGYTISASLSFMYSLLFSFYYVRDHWKTGVLSMLVIANILMLVICIITYIFKNQLSNHLKCYNPLTILCDNRKYRIIMCWLIFWIERLICYARPLRQKGENRDWDFSQRALFEFCWYTTSIAVVIAILGVYYIIKDKDKRRQTFVFLATGGCMLIIYIWKPAVAMDHLWASRRWISVCIPFIFILASYGLVQILSKYTRKKRIVSLFTAVTIMGGLLLNKSKLFLFTPMLSEMQGQYENLIQNMDSDDIYFAEMSHYASVLRFVYGENVYVMKPDSQEAVIEYLKKEGGYIYFIGNIEIFGEQVKYEKIYDGEIYGTYVLQTVEVYPTELTKTGAITNIYKIFSGE